MRRLRVLAAAVACLGVLAPAGAAQAGQTGNYRYLAINEDGFLNYDNGTTSGANNSNVDWGVSILYWNNAEVDKVKDAFLPDYNVGASGASAQYLYLNDGAGYRWDGDSGHKTAYPSCFGDTRHARVYADGDDIMYTTSLGRYVFSTTHKDFDEACNPHFGETEQTERDLAAKAKGKSGWSVSEDYGYMYNYETNCPRSTNSTHPSCTGRNDALKGGDHKWQVSGYATYIRVP